MIAHRLSLIVAVAILATACASTDGDIQLDTTTTEDTADSTSADLRFPEVAPADVIPELRPTPDSGADLQLDSALLCEPGEGCFLDPCLENADCLSGWCVLAGGEGVCSRACDTECPAGWSCKQVAGSRPDVVFICVSNHANLCKPCATAEGCSDAGGGLVPCVLLEPGSGSFCGGACDDDEDCPAGFACGEAQATDGTTSLQCLPTSGECPCSALSTAQSLSTPCEVANEAGACAGLRICGPEGLSDCDAPSPALELCNGLDDDCDGEADEPTLVDGEYVLLCDDGDACTEDTCAGDAGCATVPLDDTGCDDADPCTLEDSCAAGICLGEVVVCDDGNPCTDDACVEGECQFVPNGIDCDDGDPCTVADECDGGACAGTAVDCACQQDADCEDLEDGDVCNGILFCDTGKFPFVCAIVEGSPVDCPAPEGVDAPCLLATCDPLTGACGLAGANDGGPCDDEDACSIGDLCSEGNCAPGAPANCADDNPCTDDLCAPESGCVSVPNDAPCDDGDVCTSDDLCQGGSCAPGPGLPCDDGNPCTDDSCDPLTGCVYTPNSSSCDDGNACTDGDVCAGGSCVGGPPLGCADGNPCTDDSCVPSAGCVHAFNISPCEDGDACTVGDLCGDGACVGGAPLNCADDNPCTDDLCDAVAGCQNPANAAPCDDGDICTTADHCADAVCAGGEALDCGDGNPCTDDSCSSAVGCLHMANAAPCAEAACDAGVHLSGATCTGGACPAAIETVCDDGNPCTDDSCDAALGCLTLDNEAPCEAAACVDGVHYAATACATGACPPQAETACPFLCGPDGCFGECLPGSAGCDDVVPLICDDAGVWSPLEPCPTACAGGLCTVPDGPIALETTTSSPNLFVGDGGRPVVFFTESDAEHSDVRMATFEGTWDVETVFAGYRIGQMAVDAGADGSWHLIMGKFGESSVSYGTGPTPWAIDSVVTGIPTGGPTGVLDEDGDFHISASTSLSTRTYATNAGGSWTTSPVSSSSTGVAALSVYGADAPTIVYNRWNTRRIYVTQGPDFAGGQTLLQSYGVDQGPRLSLELFGSDRHLAYSYTYDYYTHYRIIYTTDGGGSWSPVTVANGGPSVIGLDLSLDPEGSAHIIHTDANGDLYYHSNHTGSWSSTLILDGGSSGGTIDALYHEGMIWIVYRDADQHLAFLEVDPSILD